MRCLSCRKPLVEPDLRCPQCGYSAADTPLFETLPAESGTAVPGQRPADVVLAVKLLACGLAFSVYSILAVELQFGMLGGIYAKVLLVQIVLLALSGGFIFLIWSGVDWARRLYLLTVALRAAFLIWGLLFAVSFNATGGFLASTFSGTGWLSFALHCVVAYLLFQPESARWFQ